MEAVAVAALGAAGLIGSTWIGTRRVNKAVAEVKEVQRQVSNVNVSIGQPNGKGNLTQMLENLIEWKGSHLRDHQHLDEMFGPSK
jgi:hypothetical protein